MYAWIHRKRAGKITEDEMTSCVFGPLRMMAGMEPGKTWAMCLHVLQCGHLFSKDFEPTDVSVRFWPRFRLGQRRYVEPDVHVIARRGADVRTILVEVKSGTRLGNDQLLSQWTNIQLPAERSGPPPGELRRRSAHVLLGFVRPRHRRDIDVQEARARTAGIAWGDRLVTITWGHFALLIQALQGITESLRADVLDFLRIALRVVPVVPFEGVGIANLGPVAEQVIGFGGVRLRHFQVSRGLRWVFHNGSATK